MHLKCGRGAIRAQRPFNHARHGIRLNSIAPGPFPTEGAWARLDPLKEGAIDEDPDNRYRTRNPMGRVGRPSELANMAAFLLSDHASWVSGQILHVDGGISSLRV